MFPFLFLLRVTYCYCMEKVFTGYTGVSINGNYELPHHETSTISCAVQCVTEQEQCTGFRYEAETMTCNLYTSYCIGENGDDSILSGSIGKISMNTLLARGRPSSMSSLYNGDSQYNASKGNDGIFPDSRADGDDHDYMFHTTNDVNPWWRVDMESERCVWAVWFMNRGFLGEADYLVVANRAKKLMITVSLLESEIMDDGDNRCGYVETPEILNNTAFCQQPLVGRFVQIQSMSLTYLHLYEVEVHGF